MSKSKKHSPIQSENDSLVEQIPKELMGQAIRELVELAQKKEARSKESNSQNEGYLLQDPPSGCIKVD
jgi:hypothetical protein